MTQRRYPSLAEKARAYRQRLKQRLAGQAPAPVPPRRPRQRTRPQRLQAILDDLQALLDEYRAWVEAIPENLRESDIVGQLEETIDSLESAHEALTSIEPPRGFGR